MQYRTSRLVAGPLLRTLARPRITGAEHIPATGPAIVASNHLSVVDSIFLPFMLERTLVFAAKSEYFTGTRLQDRAIAAYLHGRPISFRSTAPRRGPPEGHARSPHWTCCARASCSASIPRAPGRRTGACTAAAPGSAIWP